MTRFGNKPKISVFELKLFHITTFEEKDTFLEKLIIVNFLFLLEFS